MNKPSQLEMKIKVGDLEMNYSEFKRIVKDGLEIEINVLMIYLDSSLIDLLNLLKYKIYPPKPRERERDLLLVKLRAS